MNVKKVIGAIGIAVIVVALSLAAMRVITWPLFWMIAILVAAVAYFVLPRMSEP